MEFRLPELGEGVYEAEFGEWAVQVGETVHPGQTLAQVLTDKAVMEVPSPFAGTVDSLRAEPGQQVKVGEAILTYSARPEANESHRTGQPGDESGPDRAESVAAVKRPVVTAPAGGLQVHDSDDHRFERPRSTGNVGAAPSVRLMARKLGLDLMTIQGTGPGGRVLFEDLLDQVQAAGTGQTRRPAEPQPDYGTPGTRIRFQGIRRKIAEHLVHATHTIPHYTYIDECDVTDLVRVRESLREHALTSGARLTYLAFFVKAAVAALREVPLVNSSLDEEAGEIKLHAQYHIGIATATPQGLIVPVIRDADRKDVLQIATEIDRLSALARSGKAPLEDLRGSTFTITSIGGIGGLASTPVINHPEVAILGIGKVVKRPVYDASGNLRPAEMVYLSLSFDHRVVDGAVGAVFSNALIRHLQRPALLLLPSRNSAQVGPT